jgi:zinc transporter 5/7
MLFKKIKILLSIISKILNMEYFQKIFNELLIVYSGLQEKENLKNLALFLILNLFFMFVEILFGLIRNSLGLLTDGALMLLDCSAIMIGLYTTYLTTLKPNSKFHFGYHRTEVIGTFINSVFLLFIAIYVIFQSLERFIQPKQVDTSHLFTISFLGLFINLIGISFLYNQGIWKYIKALYNEKIKNKFIKSETLPITNNEDVGKINDNLYAVYLHIIADALGSVSVIISTFFITFFDLSIMDPIFSLIISILILYFIFPVLRNSTYTLIHHLPGDIMELKKNIENEITNFSGYNHFIASFDMWLLKPEIIVCDIKIQVENSSHQREIYEKVKILLKQNKIEESNLEFVS